MATEQEDPLRLAFVEMLFALAVGQVAIHAGDLARIGAPIGALVPAISHLVVALLLIAASWVGWRQSVSPGIREHQVKTIFSRPFAGLMLDVLLVVIYFVVVRTVEIDEKAGVQALTPPSASPEALWVSIVFAVYVVWDVVNDVLSEGCLPEQDRLSKGWRIALASTYCSFVCMALSALAYWTSTIALERTQVVFVDAMLVCVILLFRSIKASEKALATWLGVENNKAFARARDITGKERKISIGLAVAYVVCLCSVP